MIYVIFIIVLAAGLSLFLIAREKVKNPMSFYESVQLCKLPIISFKVGNENLNFMLDSGGMRSFIDSRAVALLNLPYEEVRSNIHVYGITGNIVENKLIHMKLSYKDQEYESDFVAQDLGGSMDMMKEEYGVRIHGMLGTDFFERYKYVLDFKNMIAYSKK